jgi:poly(hydroxyalkanoate) granule-associated protein
MVKKMKSTADKAASTASGAAAGLMDSQLAHSVKESAQQIWLAGMGAFSKAQAEGGKVFETLVKEGLNLQKKTQHIAEDKISEVTGKMSAMAATVTSKAGQNYDKLEAIFEQRTAQAMNKLGVPTAKDVDALVKRVDELAKAVAQLSKGGKDSGKAAVVAAPKAATKAAVKAVAKPIAKAKAATQRAASPFAQAVAKKATRMSKAMTQAAPAKRARKAA